MDYISTLVTTESTLLEYQNGILKNSSIKNASSRQLRCSKHGKLAIVSGEKESPLSGLLEMAEEIIPHGEEIDYALPSDQSYLHKEPRRSSFVEGLSTSDLSDLAKQYLDLARTKLNGLSIDLNIAKTKASVELKSSSGNYGEYSYFDLDLTVQAMGLKESEIFEWNRSLPSIPQGLQDLDEFFENFLQEVQLASRVAGDLQPGKYPFIFCPEILNSGLLVSFFSGISPTLIENKSSPLWDRLGSKIFSDRVTFEEKALEIPFDSDGLPTGAKFIVNEGTLKMFPIPLEYSKKLKSAPTGNGFGGFPFSDFYFHPGAGDIQAWLTNINRGVMLISSYNLTQGNLVNGDLSGIISLGLVIENGEIVGRVKDRTCTFNLYEVLGKNLRDISAKTQIYGLGRSLSIPWVLAEEVEVS